MSLVLAVDFDQTLIDEVPPPVHWRPYAKETLFALKDAGHQLVLFSSRLTPRYELCSTPSARAEADEFWRTGTLPPDVLPQWERCAAMREFLIRESAWELFDAVWQNPGKPPCDKFIDDRFEAPNWLDVFRMCGMDVPGS